MACSSSTPTHRLPVELWAMTWEALPLRDRVRVTQVCHAWRTLAHSSPHIWANLDLVIGSDDVDDDITVPKNAVTPDYCAALAPIFARSHQLQLRVSVRFNSAAATPLDFEELSVVSFAALDLITMLRAERHRLVYLCLQVTRAELAPYLLWSLGPFPELQDLQCNIVDGKEGPSNSTYPMPFYRKACPAFNAPQLRRLAVDSSVYHWLPRYATSPSSPPVPTKMNYPPAALNIPNLTSLNMGIKSLNDLFDIFIACPRLSFTHFTMQQSSWYFMETRRPFGVTERALLVEHSQHLESLRIDDIPPDLEKGAAMYKEEWELLWTLVGGPRCCEVELHYWMGVEPHDANPETRFFSRDAGRKPEAPAPPFTGLELFKDLASLKLELSFGEHRLVVTAAGLDADGRVLRRTMSFKHTPQLREQVITDKPRGLWSLIRPEDVVSLHLCGVLDVGLRPGTSAAGSSSFPRRLVATDLELVQGSGYDWLRLLHKVTQIEMADNTTNSVRFGVRRTFKSADNLVDLLK